LSYGVGSQLSADAQDKVATFFGYAIYNPDVKEKLEAAFIEEIKKVVNEGFTQEELDAAKKGVLQGNIVNRSEDPQLLTILNNNMMFDRDMMYYKKLDEQIEKLTLADINGAFRKHIKPDRFNIVKAGDFKDKVIKP
jgi:zinc protease